MLYFKPEYFRIVGGKIDPKDKWIDCISAESPHTHKPTPTHAHRGSTLGINDCHFPCAVPHTKICVPFIFFSCGGPSKPGNVEVMDNLIAAAP